MGLLGGAALQHLRARWFVARAAAPASESPGKQFPAGGTFMHGVPKAIPILLSDLGWRFSCLLELQLLARTQENCNV
jgi:hypothetical protein